MSKLDRVAPIKAKIKRAKKHIDDLDSAIDLFLEREPYRQVGHDDVETGDRVVALRVVEEVPSEILTIVGDAIHNLRASLDYLVASLVLANGKAVNTRTAFPICQSLDDFNTRGMRQIEGVSRDASDLIQALRPYKGGNATLWRLHSLDIIDKHRFLIALACYNDWFQWDVDAIIPLDAFFPTIKRGHRELWSRMALKDGAILLRIKRVDRMPVNVDPEFSFQIAFGEVCEGEPLVPSLFQLTNAIVGIIEVFLPLL